MLLILYVFIFVGGGEVVPYWDATNIYPPLWNPNTCTTVMYLFQWYSYIKSIFIKTEFNLNDKYVLKWGAEMYWFHFLVSCSGFICFIENWDRGTSLKPVTHTDVYSIRLKRFEQYSFRCTCHNRSTAIIGCVLTHPLIADIERTLLDFLRIFEYSFYDVIRGNRLAITMPRGWR